MNTAFLLAIILHCSTPDGSFTLTTKVSDQGSPVYVMSTKKGSLRFNKEGFNRSGYKVRLFEGGDSTYAMLFNKTGNLIASNMKCSGKN